MNDEKKAVLLARCRTSNIVLCGIYLALALIVYFSFQKWESDHYRQLIPSEIDIGRTILISGETGFREGCGIAVFELTQLMKERILAHGIAAFGKFQQRKIDGSDTNFALDWTETPYVETGDGLSLEDSWTGGLSCVNGHKNIVGKIYHALRHSGSFIRKRNEAVVIVIPASSFVALVYFG